MSVGRQVASIADEPRREIATGHEIVFRVGGGPTSLPAGRFFSPIKASCVSQAELRSNVGLWGNRCYFIATFRVRPGTEMWIGRVSHESTDVADRSAKQILIENPDYSVELVRDIEALRQDVFVSPRAGRA